MVGRYAGIFWSGHVTSSLWSNVWKVTSRMMSIELSSGQLQIWDLKQKNYKLNDPFKVCRLTPCRTCKGPGKQWWWELRLSSPSLASWKPQRPRQISSWGWRYRRVPLSPLVSLVGEQRKLCREEQKGCSQMRHRAPQEIQFAKNTPVSGEVKIV